MVFAVRTESFASAARRKLAVLTTIADVLAVAEPRGILLMSCPCEASRANAFLGRTKSRGLLLCPGRAKPRALFWFGSGGSLVEL